MAYLSVRVRDDKRAAIKVIAHRKRISVQRLMNEWVDELIEQEDRDILDSICLVLRLAADENLDGCLLDCIPGNRDPTLQQPQHPQNGEGRGQLNILLLLFEARHRGLADAGDGRQAPLGEALRLAASYRFFDK